MLVPKFSIGMDISTYLSHLRRIVFSRSHGHPVVVVLGNPSCDLDSFICAFVLSYFYNGSDVRKTTKRPIFVPVLNLPTVKACDLWRFRPEFGVALRGAVDGLTPQNSAVRSDEQKQKLQSRDKSLLEQLITIHEINTRESTLKTLHHAFQPSSLTQTAEDVERQNVILVDQNSPAVETINPDEYTQRFDIVGCIDHHVEEHYVPKSADPRIIKLGIGSCMSLVIEHLRHTRGWTSHTNLAIGQQQIARLALTPVLVDTWNLKAPGDKCSDLDREAATFLIDQTGTGFDPEDLFEQAVTAKNESLALLNPDECIARDYKSYVQDTKRAGKLNIGISSLVKDLNWLAGHAHGPKQLAQVIVDYAHDSERSLEVLGLLTRSGERKQVAIFAFGRNGAEAIDIFERAASDLQLSALDGHQDIKAAFDEIFAQGNWAWKLWWMDDTSKSRKQVAPLLRNAVGQT